MRPLKKKELLGVGGGAVALVLLVVLLPVPVAWA
jgi:hypothetical protein